jgi:hypothetical protein
MDSGLRRHFLNLLALQLLMAEDFRYSYLLHWAEEHDEPSMWEETRDRWLATM